MTSEAIAMTGSEATEKRKNNMPPVSQKQREAMAAAASGKSTLGIPKKVGKEFIAADPGGKLPGAARNDAKKVKAGKPVK
jgi:hypothetical protein